MQEKLTGVVKWFDCAKGYGFIQQEGEEDVFVHFKSISGDGYKKLDKGQQVTFVPVKGEKGLQAAEVEVLELEPS
ncbi:MAG: cold-shock protein [Gammaproteobacteria bacterium]|nr:cold-shock protein [Gammaproteobacteria bacterium]